jgi:hypothetical protein
VPMPADDVTGYRDWLVARTRRVQRGATVSAVVAAVGLSAGLAHTLPGHQAAASKPSVSSRSGSGGRAVPRTGHDHKAHSRRHHHRSLQPPAQPPATAPASPAPVTSGGS